MNQKVQSAVLLSAMAAAFYFLNDKKFFARVDISALCKQSYNDSVLIARNWPDSDIISWQKATDLITQWEKTLTNTNKYPATVYVYIASRILNDLQDKITNQYKLKLLSVLNKPIQTLQTFTDPEGTNFPAYELGDKAMDSLYEIIQWRF